VVQCLICKAPIKVGAAPPPPAPNPKPAVSNVNEGH
jgi:hypothetical protein